MVSTYLGYDTVVRNLKQSLTRVARQPDVARNASYYKENIGKVKTVDDFLKNDRSVPVRDESVRVGGNGLCQGLHEEGAGE